MMAESRLEENPGKKFVINLDLSKGSCLGDLTGGDSSGVFPGLLLRRGDQKLK